MFDDSDDDYRRQISKLSGCELRIIGTLKFDHHLGACTSVNDEKIYLCFNWDFADNERCRYANDPLATFTKAASSEHAHSGASIAASECEFKTLSFLSIFKFS